MYAKPQKVQKTPPHKRYSKYEMRLIFKRVLDEADYRKLAHFVFLDKPFKENIPGTYSVYHMVEDGVIIATNAVCINQWLRLHGLLVRPALSEATVGYKIQANGTDAIDTRTPESVEMRNRAKPRGRRPKVLTAEIDQITANVWNWYTAGVGAGEISKRISCTPANVYYYLKKYKKHNPNWEDELEVDN